MGIGAAAEVLWVLTVSAKDRIGGGSTVPVLRAFISAFKSEKCRRK